MSKIPSVLWTCNQGLSTPEQDTARANIAAAKNALATPSTSGTGGSNGLMSAADKEKLDALTPGGQTNVIETVKVDGTALPVTDKAVNVDLSGKANVTHPHGLISSDGKITGNGGTVNTGDYLLFADKSNSSEINYSPDLTFNMTNGAYWYYERAALSRRASWEMVQPDLRMTEITYRNPGRYDNMLLDVIYGMTHKIDGTDYPIHSYFYTETETGEVIDSSSYIFHKTRVSTCCYYEMVGNDDSRASAKFYSIDFSPAVHTDGDTSFNIVIDKTYGQSADGGAQNEQWIRTYLSKESSEWPWFITNSVTQNIHPSNWSTFATEAVFPDGLGVGVSVNGAYALAKLTQSGSDVACSPGDIKVYNQDVPVTATDHLKLIYTNESTITGINNILNIVTGFTNHVTLFKTSGAGVSVTITPYILFSNIHTEHFYLYCCNLYDSTGSAATMDIIFDMNTVSWGPGTLLVDFDASLKWIGDMHGGIPRAQVKTKTYSLPSDRMIGFEFIPTGGVTTGTAKSLDYLVKVDDYGST